MTGRACKSLPLFPALQSISTTPLPRLDRVPAGTADMWCAESQCQHLKVENKMVGGEMKKITSTTLMEGDLAIPSKSRVHLPFNLAILLL